MKPQCIVTSYCRPKYLHPCLESMRQDDIELYVIDGGSDQSTKDYIRELADGYLFFDGNPGADVLKTEGIRRFVTQPEFIISSDDYLFPAGWTTAVMDQYRVLRPLGFAMVTCPTELVISRHYEDQPYWANGKAKYARIAGIELMEVGSAMVAGSVMDTAVVRQVGYFPIYGKTGQGDWAMGKRLRALNLKSAYLRHPVIKHLGQNKDTDYPEYSKAFDIDNDKWLPIARQDDWRP